MHHYVHGQLDDVSHFQSASTFCSPEKHSDFQNANSLDNSPASKNKLAYQRRL